MKSYTKTIIRKEELAEIMVRPLLLDQTSTEIANKVINKIMSFNKTKFIIAAKKATNLDIVNLVDGKYYIRYAIN